MKRRSFSLLLARRYLNPRRSMISSFTLISLTGVLLGVLVLVVVMAVYAGLERNFKSRLLGFAPHVLVRDLGGGPLNEHWPELAKDLAKVPHVEAATAYIQDYVILDLPAMGDETEQKPVLYSAVDTSDAKQVASLNDMLDRKGHPDSSADLGIDDRIIISSLLADDYQLRTGDQVRLISARNLNKVLELYKTTDRPLLRDDQKAQWDIVSPILRDKWSGSGGANELGFADYRAAYQALMVLLEHPMRDIEAERVNAMLVAMDQSEKDEAAEVFRFTAEQKAAVMEPLDLLANAEVDVVDSKVLHGLKQLVVPKDVTIAGVYQASLMVATPDVFLPLPLAQGLAGFEDGEVSGISLRLDDPYLATGVAGQVNADFANTGFAKTWEDQFGRFFELINQQRVMMYFTLSFIVLISAFSMMAVMFTVTIQKRREIGVMKALGAAPGQIVRVFLYQGMLLGLLGSVLGLVLGRLVLRFRGELQTGLRAVGFDPFDAKLIGFDKLPAFNDPKEQLGIAVLGFVLCSLAALLPAFFAARSDAARSLRNL